MTLFLGAGLPESRPWWPLILGTLLIGMNKAGLRGLNLMVLPVFAAWFGGRISTAVVLPLLLAGDICAVFHYRSSVDRQALLRLMPAALAGIAAGMLLGRLLPDEFFRYTMGGVLLVCLVPMVHREFSSRRFRLPGHWLAHSFAGFMGGFSSMIGNAATPIMAIYLMAMNLGKSVFIGTGAVFLIVVNAVKVPIHTSVWYTMTADTLGISLRLAPLVIPGFLAGLLIVNRIPEKPYRLLVLAATLAGTLSMFL